MLQGPVQIEPLTKFDPNERMQSPRSGAAAQEIDTLSAQRPGTRTGEKEPDSLLLDHELHLVEQLRHFLDFVDHDDGGVVRDLLPDQIGIARQTDE